ncbi:hypothetical protein RV11_GL000695 [Enterococcus phoeniculicola]|uniref:WxL domain-containing protein n=1 Tax=Enterococcus phoeniculicola ATCC BAA-412 TaxID=1158610 RepID=R3WKY4_9ENTE|nr:WxL domain-containing protein [Enterococcus phoeniculicola]EOL42525.1 hypothetical protein UC3_02877 [Enterococcus phoeniculicola ATCC BAA-412]EOT79196.1 hypothetical protein I589_00704 [Enterococcus phoeniculicola ATCC BAA-412]OJG70980.1 hypothetical protein RV11_GL000695 [Enterococcus phoeniculicola]
MKKTSLLFSAVLLGSLAVGTGSAYAAGIGTAADPAQGTATILFKDNDSTTGPVDPTDPTKPNPETLPDDENDKTDAPGPLSLDVYPAFFSFGEQMVDLAGGTYDSVKTGTHYVQVTDNRDDLGGWTVSMKRTEFENASGNKLTGSGLYIPAGTARNTLVADPTVADSNAKLGLAEGTGDFSGMYAIGLTESKLFGYGNDVPKLVGKGTTAYSWDASAEKLHVPAGVAKKGTFTSTIDWTLTADVMN